MSDMTRDQRLNAAFVRAADTLVEDYDTVDLLHDLVEECAAILDTDAGGLMLADGENRLQVVASTSEEVGLVEIMQLNAGEGPCVESFQTGLPVAVADIDTVREKWPQFSEAALSQGFRSMYATPLRLRRRTIGAMNLFSKTTGELNAEDIATARALADVATIGILQERLIREAHIVTEQLQHALDSRVIIEQAKGVVSQVHAIGLDDAFRSLRSYARNHQQSLRSVAEAVVSRKIDAWTVTAAPVNAPPRH